MFIPLHINHSQIIKQDCWKFKKGSFLPNSYTCFSETFMIKETSLLISTLLASITYPMENLNCLFVNSESNHKSGEIFYTIHHAQDPYQLQFHHIKTKVFDVPLVEHYTYFQLSVNTQQTHVPGLSVTS